MKSFWLNLADREKTTVTIGAAVVTVLLIYLLIWSPLSAGVASEQKTMMSQKQLLQWIKPAATRIQQFRNAGIDPTQKTHQPLLSLVETTLAQQRLSGHLTAIKQPHPHELTLQFQDIPFDGFIQWTQSLWQHHAITVKTINLRRTGTVGLVNIKLVIER